jgi:hypothetical protein
VKRLVTVPGAAGHGHNVIGHARDMLGVTAVVVLPFITTTLVAAVAPTVTASRHGGNAGLIRSKRHFAGRHRLPAKFTITFL